MKKKKMPKMPKRGHMMTQKQMEEMQKMGMNVGKGKKKKPGK